MVALDAPNLIITAVKPAGNPLAAHAFGAVPAPAGAITVRCYEAEGSAAAAHLTSDSPLAEVWKSDLLEHRLSDLPVTRPRWGKSPYASLEAGPCQIHTLGIRLEPPSADSSFQDLGPAMEPGQPVHTRYWEHNAGAAPLGNQPLSLWLRGPIPLGQNTRFGLGLSNDSSDREMVGTVQVIVPQDWTCIPREVPYRIPPHSEAVYEIMVVTPPEAAPCFLRAVTQPVPGDQLDDPGQALQDVLPVGDIADLSVTLKREDAAFLVTLENPNGDYVEGELRLITPLESWGAAVDGFALSQVSPRLHCFRLEAGGKGQFRFPVQGDMTGLWAVAKVAWYGRLQYAQEQTPQA